MLNAKCLKGNHVGWIRNVGQLVRDASNSWKSFVRAFSWISKGLSWKVGNGSKVLVAINLVVGNGEN